VFPTTADYDRLTSASDQEVLAMWRASVANDAARRCCAYHTDQVTWTTGDEEWHEALHTEVECRGFSPQEQARPEPDTSLNCSCGAVMSVEPGDYGDCWFVCVPCGTRRRAGNHLDCRMGQPEVLATT